MTLKLFSRTLLTLTLLCVSAPAPAARAPSPHPTLLDARSLAMGGAVRALSRPVESARVNPAGLGPNRGFFAGSSYATRSDSPYDAFSLTVVDNITSPMAGAIQYQRITGEEEREDLSLGLALGKQGMWWGFTLRYVHGRENRRGEWRDVFTGDLGVLFERPGGTRFAVVGYDLADDTSLGFLERRVAGGVAQTGLGNWNLAADLVRNLDRDFAEGLDLHLGAEYQRPEAPWAVRLGQMWRGDTNRDYQSLGAGYLVSGWILDYAVQRCRQRGGEVLQMLSVSGSF